MPRWLRLIVPGVLVLGLFTWAYKLGNWGTGDSLDESQTIGNGLDVAVLTSDPAVAVATELTVLPPTGWQLRITLDGPQIRDTKIHQGKILVVLSGGLRLASFAEDELLKSGMPVHHYPAKQFPWTYNPAAATTIEVPYAGSSDRGYVTDLDHLIGDLSSDLVAHTAIGVDMAAPSGGQPFVDCPQTSRHFLCAVSPKDLTTLLDGGAGWHGRERPGTDQPTATLEALLSGNWSITSSNPPPKSQGTTWIWKDQPSILHRTIIRFVSTDEQRNSQRDLLWSGVILGVVGGVLATWVTGLGAVGPRRSGGSASGGPEHPPEGRRRSAGRGRMLRMLVPAAIGILVAARILSRSRPPRR